MLRIFLPSRALQLHRTHRVRRSLHTTNVAVPGVTIEGTIKQQHVTVLCSHALFFLADVHRKFQSRRQELVRKCDPSSAESLKDVEYLNQTYNGWRMVVPCSTLKYPSSSSSSVRQNGGTAESFDQLLDNLVDLRDNLERPKNAGMNRSDICVTVRPWALEVENVMIDEQFACASLLDFSLFFFHGVYHEQNHNHNVFFSLPAMNSRLEGRLWRDIFEFAENYFDQSRGCVRILNN